MVQGPKFIIRALTLSKVTPHVMLERQLRTQTPQAALVGNDGCKGSSSYVGQSLYRSVDVNCLATSMRAFGIGVARAMPEKMKASVHRDMTR